VKLFSEIINCCQRITWVATNTITGVKSSAPCDFVNVSFGDSAAGRHATNG